MNVFRKKTWSPYLAGGATGIVLCLSVLVSGKYFGASTTYVRFAGFLEKAVSSEHVSFLEYFSKTGIRVDWQMMFLVGIAIGAFIAAALSGDFSVVFVPPMWRERFGAGMVRRWVAAFIGGIVALFGARLAGGCPSGHGLSGLAQMAVSGYVSLIFFIVAGVITARILYRKRRG